MKNSSFPQKDRDTAKNVHFTAGEFFPDGSALELIAAASRSDPPQLLLRTERKTIVSPEIEHQGHVYQALPLNPGFQQAMLLPSGTHTYPSIRHIFEQMIKGLKKFAALPEPQTELVAFWAISTWFADCLVTPPTLWVSGPDVARAMILFQLLRQVCRRGVILAGLTPAKIATLPTVFHPTLLLHRPSASAVSLLLDANFQGVLVPGPGGALLDVTGAKAIFTGTQELPQGLGNQAIHVRLSPLDDAASNPSTKTISEIENYFQPRLLQYRLDYRDKVGSSRFVVRELRSPTRELAKALGACIQGDDELAVRPAALLKEQDDMLDSCGLDLAMMQVLWPRLNSHHAGAPVTEMRIGAELTAEINTYRLAAGEASEFSPEAVGARAALLGLERTRKKAGSMLLLTPQTSRRVHQLARNLDPAKYVPGCPDCEPVPGDRPPAGVGV